MLPCLFTVLLFGLQVCCALGFVTWCCLASCARSISLLHAVHLSAAGLVACAPLVCNLSLAASGSSDDMKSAVQCNCQYVNLPLSLCQGQHEGGLLWQSCHCRIELHPHAAPDTAMGED